MTLKQISVFINGRISPLINYTYDPNTIPIIFDYSISKDPSGNYLLPIGATYLNHTIVNYSITNPPTLLLTIFYSI